MTAVKTITNVFAIEIRIEGPEVHYRYHNGDKADPWATASIQYDLDGAFFDANGVKHILDDFMRI